MRVRCAFLMCCAWWLGVEAPGKKFCEQLTIVDDVLLRFSCPVIVLLFCGVEEELTVL